MFPFGNQPLFWYPYSPPDYIHPMMMPYNVYEHQNYVHYPVSETIIDQTPIRREIQTSQREAEVE